MNAQGTYFYPRIDQSGEHRRVFCSPIDDGCEQDSMTAPVVSTRQALNHTLKAATPTGNRYMNYEHQIFLEYGSR